MTACPTRGRSTVSLHLLVAVFALGALGCATAAPGRSPSQDDGWSTLVSADEGFSISFPGSPARTVNTEQTEDGPLTLVMYQQEQGNSLYSLNYSDLGIEAIVEPAEVLRGAQQGMVERGTGKVLQEREVSLPGPNHETFPGREFTGEVGEGMVLQSRIYLVGPRLYQVMLIHPVSAEDVSFDRFAQSFKVTAPPRSVASAAIGGAKGAQQANLPWPVVSRPDEGFALAFPSAPTRETGEEKTKAGAIPTITYAVEQGESYYAVSLSEFPEEMIRNALPGKMLEGAQAGSLANVNGQLVDEKVIFIDGTAPKQLVPGREFRAVTPTKLAVRSRLFLSGRRMYQLILVQKEDQASEADFERFSSSFKLIAKPKK